MHVYDAAWMQFAAAALPIAFDKCAGSGKSPFHIAADMADAMVDQMRIRVATDHNRTERQSKPIMNDDLPTPGTRQHYSDD
jgi:hypothetical protein